MPKSTILSISGPRVLAQARYYDSGNALRTGAEVIARKCHNCASLLITYGTYQRRYPDRALIVQRSINAIRRIEYQSTQSPASRTNIFLNEARAARAYWQAVAVLFNTAQPGWKRHFPHATDPVNLLFNTGYTFLARWIRDAIQRSGLLPEIGVLHAVAAGHEPLVYDLMELFRQPVIDAVVVPLLTKKKRRITQLTKRDMARAVAKMHEQWKKPWPYHGKCWPIREIAYHETLALAEAMRRKEPWGPYRHAWGHGWSCAQYRHSPKKKGLHP